MDFADRAEAALRQKGNRITSSRRALLELIGQSPRPLGPAELHDILRKAGVRIDRVSVYRNVSALLDAGLLHRVLGSTAVRPCQAPADAQPRCHHAIVCTGCGATAEFHAPAVERALKGVRKVAGFRVLDGHLLELRGLCARCADAEC